MSRHEFSKATKIAAIKRATRGGVVYCDGCGLPAKRFEIDHVRADGLLGDNTLENAQLLCKGSPKCCHDKKSVEDMSSIAQAKRQEARHIGADRPKSKLSGRPKIAKPKRDQLPIPNRRQIYRDAGI